MRAPVDSLGFLKEGPTATGHHYYFDLNESQWHERWRTELPAYDVIVIAEVLEHLHTSPTLILGFLKSLLKPGGLLIIQTPNAAAIGNRIKLLLGINPFDFISENPKNPLHLREYTEQELHMYASMAGFKVVESTLLSYFDHRYGVHRQPTTREFLKGSAHNIVNRFVPRNLRAGITLVLSSDKN